MKRRYKWILAAAILTLSLGVYGAVLLKPVPAQAESAEVGSLERSVTVQGKLIPEKSTVLNAQTAATVGSLPFKPGEKVDAGQVLMESGAASQTELDLKKEQLTMELTTAKQEYERMFGKNGSAESALESAKSQYNLAEKNYSNAKTLADAGGFISQSDLSTLKTQRDLAAETLKQAREAASESSRTYYMTQITSVEKQLELLEQSVSPGNVTMPYDGVLWEVYVSQGAYITPNQPVVKVYDSRDLIVEVSLLSEDAVLMEKGQQAEVIYPDGSSSPAVITFLAQTAAKEVSSVGLSENRTMMELKPSQVPDSLGAGQGVDITFRLVMADQVISVPSSAIVPDKEGSAVYLAVNGKAHLVTVETGKKTGGRTEVLSGVAEGDIVLTDPYENGVKEGTKVQLP